MGSLAAATNLVPVVRNDLQLGVPIPHSVYDRSGQLLLKAGFRINLERHLQILLSNGLYFDQATLLAPVRPRSVTSVMPQQEEEQGTFELVENIKERLRKLFEYFRVGRDHDTFVLRVETLSLAVQEACTHDTDAVLACLNLDYEMPYEVIHHLLAAVLCELIGKRLGVKEESRSSLVMAALTHDIGLIDLQDTLDKQEGPLTVSQKTRVAAHSTESTQVLRDLGVRDPTWLDAVLHHHERIDGSGYPDQLVGDALRPPARILAVADNYSAMVRDRPYRKAMVSRAAMRELMVDQGNKIDQRLIQAMIKEIGIFPPGVLVKLASGEVAVVKERLENTAAPAACAFIKPDGMPMLTLIRRDTSKVEYNIEGIVPFSQYRGSVSLIRSLWVSH